MGKVSGKYNKAIKGSGMELKKPKVTVDKWVYLSRLCSCPALSENRLVSSLEIRVSDVFQRFPTRQKGYILRGWGTLRNKHSFSSLILPIYGRWTPGAGVLFVTRIFHFWGGEVGLVHWTEKGRDLGSSWAKRAHRKVWLWRQWLEIWTKIRKRANDWVT